MRQHLLRGAAAIVFLAGTPVLAADLPVYVEPVEPAPVVMAPLWTGFYVGAQAGAAFFHDDDSCSYDQFDYGEAVDLFGFDDVDEDFFNEDLSEDFDYSCSDISEFVPDGSITPYNDPEDFQPFYPNGDDDDDDTRWFAGAHVGYDHQIGSFVIGAVLDANWLGGDDDDVQRFDADLYRYEPGTYNTGQVGGNTVILAPIPGADPVAPTYEWSEGGIDWYGTLRARAGFAMGRALVYATGGLAFGGGDDGEMTTYYSPLEADSAGVDDPASGCEETSFTDYPTDTGTDGGGAYICSDDDDDDGVRWGYALGGGVDFLVTDNVSVGAEALYVNLDGGDGFGGIFDEDDDDDSDLDFWTLGVKASYRFGG